jgi:surfeit locus 1 family protein
MRSRTAGRDDVSATPSTDRDPRAGAAIEGPRWWTVARRPKWLAALVLCLAIAASFAALGQWQVERAVETATPVGPVGTEEPRPLADVDEPQTSVQGDEAGYLVAVAGAFDADDWLPFADRFRVGDARGGGSERGDWVVGRLQDEAGASVIVALGWAEDDEAADRAIAAIAESGDADAAVELTGRYLPGESPEQSDFEAGARTAISAGELVNLWDDAQPIYNGYLVLDDASLTALDVPGLQAIEAPAPLEQSSLNLLNVFYAVEWAVFAGFALYIWYRLVRDEQEKETEALREMASGAAPPPAG